MLVLAARTGRIYTMAKENTSNFRTSEDLHFLLDISPHDPEVSSIGY